METMHLAMERIGDLGTHFRSSPFYESPSWGYEDPEMYLNCVCEVFTDLSAEELHQITLEIEVGLGRESKKRKSGEPYRPRLIDIDILFYDDLELTTESLTIPHPRFHERNFTLKPMADIAPNFVHPALGKTISELLIASPDPGEITRLD